MKAELAAEQAQLEAQRDAELANYGGGGGAYAELASLVPAQGANNLGKSSLAHLGVDMGITVGDTRACDNYAEKARKADAEAKRQEVLQKILKKKKEKSAEHDKQKRAAAAATAAARRRYAATLTPTRTPHRHRPCKPQTVVYKGLANLGALPWRKRQRPWTGWPRRPRSRRSAIGKGSWRCGTRKKRRRSSSDSHT